MTLFIILSIVIAVIIPFVLTAERRPKELSTRYIPADAILPKQEPTRPKVYKHKNVICGSSFTWEGTLATERAVALGAPALPTDADYVFFPKLEQTQKDYGCLEEKFTNCVAVVWNGRAYPSEVGSGSQDLEKAFLRAAKSAHDKFSYPYNEMLEGKYLAAIAAEQQERVNNLLTSNTMPTIGKRRDWMDD